jgi:hypothetical protein
MAAPVARYKRRQYQWDALEYDGTNASDVIAFAGGPEFAWSEDEKIILSLQGKDPTSVKIEVMPGQWVLKPLRGNPTLTMVGESEFKILWEEDQAGPAQQPA